MVLKFEPWGDDPECNWDAENQEKLWKHGIWDFEIEECFENPHTAIPHEKARSQPKQYGDRYVVRGVTDGGRKLTVIVQYLGANKVRPVTAWDD